jgi:hypothetical protein
MLYKEKRAIYCVNRAKHNKLCGQNKICVCSQSEQQPFTLSYTSLPPHSTYFREIESQLFVLKSADICLFWLKSGGKKSDNLYEGSRELRLSWLQSYSSYSSYSSYVRYQFSFFLQSYRASWYYQVFYFI